MMHLIFAFTLTFSMGIELKALHPGMKIAPVDPLDPLSVLPFWGESNAKRFVVHFDHEVEDASEPSGIEDEVSLGEISMEHGHAVSDETEPAPAPGAPAGPEATPGATPAAPGAKPAAASRRVVHGSPPAGAATAGKPPLHPGKTGAPPSPGKEGTKPAAKPADGAAKPAAGAAKPADGAAKGATKPADAKTADAAKGAEAGKEKPTEKKQQTPEELAKAKKEETKQEAAKLVGKLKSGNQDTTNKIISDTEQIYKGPGVLKENELAARVDNCLKLVEEMNKEGHKKLAEKLKEGCELAKIDIEKEKDKVIEGVAEVIKNIKEDPAHVAKVREAENKLRAALGLPPNNAYSSLNVALVLLLTWTLN